MTRPKRAPAKRGGRSVFALGPLEARVMAIVWDAQPCTIRTIFEALNKGKRIEKRLAYTTCMTICANLVKKGYLEQHKEEKAYLYTALRTREAVVRDALSALWTLATPEQLAQTANEMTEVPF